MDRVARWITEHSRLIVAFFAVAAIVCAVLFFGVKVNYDMTAYLPADAESTVALQIMQEEFSASVPNARVMVLGLALTQAQAMKAEIEAAPGIEGVMWLDDVADLKTPLEMLDKAVVDQYYRDGTALYDVTIATDMELEATDAIYELIGEEGGISGNAASVAYSRRQVLTEVLGASSVLVPVIILILVLTTTSWIAPALFLITIGVAVLINMGTNIFFKSISYITQSVSPILQLAVSLDYAIFLLTAFENLRRTEPDVESAMVKAIKQSFVSIAASAATTVFGFFALIFMRFGIGSDLGMNLVKGVTISYISVVVFLPALALRTVKLLDKTAHRRIIAAPHGIGRALVKVRIPALILVLLLVVPCYLAQSRTDFMYGNGDPAPDSRYGQDTQKINDSFGESMALVLLVPRGDTGKETALCAELRGLKHVTAAANAAVEAKAQWQRVSADYDYAVQTMNDLAAYMSGVSASVRMLQDTLAGLSGTEGGEKLDELIQKVSQLADGYAQFHEGLVAYTGVVDALAENWGSLYYGISQLSGGTAQLSDGTKQLNDGTKDIPAQVDDMLAAYTGEGYNGNSFLSPQNENTRSVQFVLTTRAIEHPADTELAADEAAIPDEFRQFVNRLIDLFRQYK